MLLGTVDEDNTNCCAQVLGATVRRPMLASSVNAHCVLLLWKTLYQVSPGRTTPSRLPHYPILHAGSKRLPSSTVADEVARVPARDMCI